MEILISILTIWGGLFTEGLLYGFVGGSTIAILALYFYNKWELVQYIAVFAVIGGAIDFIRFLPFGSTFILLLLAVGLFLLLRKAFQRWSLVGSILTYLLTFAFYNLSLKVLSSVIENGDLSAVNVGTVSGSFGAALLMTMIYYFYEFLSSLFYKPKGGQIRLK